MITYRASPAPPSPNTSHRCPFSTTGRILISLRSNDYIALASVTLSIAPEFNSGIPKRAAPPASGSMRPRTLRLFSTFSPPLVPVLSASCPRTLRLLSPYSPPLFRVLSASCLRTLRLLSAYSPPLVCVLSASFPPSLQQVPKGAQRMMKGCSKVASPFVTLLITYSSAANTSTAQSSFLNFLQR